MPQQPKDPPKLPLLEALIARRGLSLLAIYSNRDVAALFSVSLRTVQDWNRDEKLVPRDLPGRGRYLPEDLENFLEASKRRRPKARE